MLASTPRKSGTSPTFWSALHVKTLLKATTVHLAHECMKHEAASRCRRWRANRRHLRRLPSSCMPPRRKAGPRQNPSHASGTGGAASQQPRYRPTQMKVSQKLELVAVKRVKGSSCGKHIQTKRIVAWETTLASPKKAAAISVQMLRV